MESYHRIKQHSPLNSTPFSGLWRQDSNLSLDGGIESLQCFTCHKIGSDRLLGGWRYHSLLRVCFLHSQTYFWGHQVLPDIYAGSVSVGVWQMACRRVVKVGERVVKDLASKGGTYVQAYFLTLLCCSISPISCASLSQQWHWYFGGKGEILIDSKHIHVLS